jgi:hypothetical protein
MSSDLRCELIPIEPDKKTPAELRAEILRLESVMRTMEQIEIKTTHYFAPGVYMREIFIPKGATVTGKIHKTEHLNILSRGTLAVMTEDGMKTLTASTVIKSQPGIKRVGHALEDSVWITVHANTENLDDVKKLEDLLVVDTFEQFLAFTESQKQIQGGTTECHSSQQP